MAILGTGITVAFGTSAFTADLQSVQVLDASRPEIDVTHLGSSQRDFLAGKLVEFGQSVLELSHDKDVDPPIAGSSETVTIEFPLEGAEITKAKVVGSAQVVGWTVNAPLEDRVTSTVTLRWLGDVVTTPAA